MGAGTRHPYLRHDEWHEGDADRPIAFAHRGGTDAAAENTVAAFEHAWSLGYRYLETDVHLSRDGALVAFHDPDLARTCGVDAEIGQLSVAELAAVRVDGEYPIPLLSELFDRFPGAHFNIDAKSEEAVEPLCGAVRQRNLFDRVCLASFSQRRIDRMRRILGDRLCTNLGSIGIAQLRLLGRTRRRGAQNAQIPVHTGRIRIAAPRVIAAAHRQGIPVHVWTINTRPVMEELLGLGVDGIMTDETALLKDVLAERGLWPDALV